MSAGAFAASPDHLRWEPLRPEQVKAMLDGVAFPWFIAGGWALDLFVGHETRAHHDVDVAVFRDDFDALRAHLRGWEHFIAEAGTLTPLEGALPTEAHELWSREKGRQAWQLEILVEERRGDRWVYRRHDQIGLHVLDLGRTSADGIPYVRPDVMLLYKSKQPRAADETDFLTALPHLSVADRAFLAAGLWTTAPGHRWLERLK